MTLEELCRQLVGELRAGTALMRSVGHRMREERQGAGLSLVAAAREIGISQPYLTRIERGERAPSLAVLEAACRWRGRSLAWLLTGSEAIEEEGAEGEAESTTRRAVRIPLVGRVSATPHPNVLWEAVEPPEDREVPQGAIALEVRGDSMRPVAMPGQAVLALAVADPRNGDLVAVELRDGRQMFKRWFWMAGRSRVILESVRREEIEPPVVVARRELHRVWKVIGVLF